MSMSASTVLQRLGRRQLLVVTGKGGVGKTALTAVLGRALAAAGRRVLLLEVDPRESLHEMLEVPPSGGETVDVDEGLQLRHVQSRAVLERLVRNRLRIELLARRVLASPVFGHFVEGAPGLKELAVLGYASQVLRSEGAAGASRPDVVLLDAPATGHGVSLLTAPLLVGEVLDHGPVGRLARELAGFVADPSKTAVVVVTLAEEMPVQEAIELRETIEQRLDREPELLVVNGLYPSWPGSRSERADDPLIELWRQRRAVNERELARLARRWDGPRVELPLLPLERGRALVEELVRRVEHASNAAEAPR